jgi:hypothetical protein
MDFWRLPKDSGVEHRLLRPRIGLQKALSRPFAAAHMSSGEAA